MYKPINGWTKQSMIQHIKKEFKGKSINAPDGYCLYRGPEGKKCAVGMFIPDEKYRPEMDGSDLDNGYTVFQIHNICPNNMPLEGFGLQSLQAVHDRSNPSETLQDMLEWIEKNVEVENV